MKNKNLQDTVNALRKIPFNSSIMKGKLVQLKSGQVVILHQEVERKYAYDSGYKAYKYSEFRHCKFVTKIGVFNPNDFVLIENPTTVLLIDNLKRSVQSD